MGRVCTIPSCAVSSMLMPLNKKLISSPCFLDCSTTRTVVFWGLCEPGHECGHIRATPTFRVWGKHFLMFMVRQIQLYYRLECKMLMNLTTKQNATKNVDACGRLWQMLPGVWVVHSFCHLGGGVLEDRHHLEWWEKRGQCFPKNGCVSNTDEKIRHCWVLHSWTFLF